MRGDLHVHSTASDGTCRPAELVALAVGQGLDCLSITDHDSVEGVAEAREAARGTSLTLIPGVELSSVSTEGVDVHVLGYFIDVNNEPLLEHLAMLRYARVRRAHAIVASLRDAGMDVPMDQVLELSGGGALGRSHIARVLVEAGHVESVTDAFKRLIGHGMPHYVPKESQTPREAINVISRAGGLAVIAHPGIRRLDELIEELAAHGLRGVEAYHADHTPEQSARYDALAKRLGLLRTGGSDFHGRNGPNPPLGSVFVPSDALEELLAEAA